MEIQSNNVKTCPECGAPEVDGMDCWWQLGGIGQWEFANPELYQLHFYTVACYNLQHPSKFTDETITFLGKLFCEAFDKGWSNEEVLKKVAGVYDGNKQVLRKEDAVPKLRKWSMTIADVYIPDKPEGAVERIRAWAESIRREL